MKRYLEQITETAGLYNTVGFNDDTRAFPSIPARHDLWRRIVSNWLAGLVLRAIVDTDGTRSTKRFQHWRLVPGLPAPSLT
jgi:glucuronate isomerase